VTEGGQFASPIVGTTAGFHSDLGRRELSEESTHLRTAKIDPQRRLVSLVDAVQCEHRLRRVDPYPFILRHGRLQCWLFAAPILALDAVGPSTPTGAASPGRGGRMSRQRKTAAVLRLLRGEDLETVSRGLGVTAATLSGWRDAFLAAGEAALATKSATGEELESDRLKAKLGAALIERDLLHEKIAVLEANRPLSRRTFRS
jgi:transposase